MNADPSEGLLVCIRPKKSSVRGDIVLDHVELQWGQDHFQLSEFGEECPRMLISRRLIEGLKTLPLQI
jgi:hypothetical protein